MPYFFMKLYGFEDMTIIIWQRQKTFYLEFIVVTKSDTVFRKQGEAFYFKSTSEPVALIVMTVETAKEDIEFCEKMLQTFWLERLCENRVLFGAYIKQQVGL